MRADQSDDRATRGATKLGGGTQSKSHDSALASVSAGAAADFVPVTHDRPTAAAAVPLSLSYFGGTDDQHDEAGGGGPPYPCRFSVETTTLTFSAILNSNDLQPPNSLVDFLNQKPMGMPWHWHPSNPPVTHN